MWEENETVGQEKTMRTSKTQISPVLNCNFNELSAGVAETSQPGLRDVSCWDRGPMVGKIDRKENEIIWEP